MRPIPYQILKLACAVAFSVILQGCANQLPPGGGDEDKEPPSLAGSYPKQGTVNFRGDRIEIRLSEYVDRRSLQDAFRISPPVAGEIVFDWSGQDVDVIFPQPLWKIYPDKTFLINLSSTLTDLHGNPLKQPLTFAFATGSTIDKAQISGRVFKNDNKVSVLAYNISDGEGRYDPSVRLADYITEGSDDGNYTLSNLAPGKYRIVAIEDDDRNMFYTADRENFSVLSEDIIVQDSMSVKDVDFYFYHIRTDPKEINLDKFFKDSLDIVRSSVKNNTLNLPSDQSIFFYFKNSTPLRSDLEANFQIKDEQGNILKTVFNWKNDSLLEVFPALNFLPGSRYTVSFPLPLPDGKTYQYKLTLRTALSNSFGDVSGSIKLPPQYEPFPAVIVQLESQDTISGFLYNFTVRDTSFNLKKILENSYNLFAFIDMNGDGMYDYGKPAPYQPSEPFFIYPKLIKVMGGWVIENIVIDFTK